MAPTQQGASQASTVPQANVLVIGPPSGAAYELLRTILARRGHAVDCIASDISAVDDIGRYDLLVLEIDVWDVDTAQRCTRVREVTRTPLLVLVPETARRQGIQALELGADAFVSIPFDRRELVARIEALVRRYRGRWLPLALS